MAETSERFDQYSSTGDPVTSENMTEADSLCFAELSYYVFENIDFTKTDKYNSLSDLDGVSLKDYCALIIEQELETDPSKLAMLENISKKENQRYSNCTISGFDSKLDDTEQWAAVTISLNDSENTSVISFRGTDGTAIGWEEDFEMAYSLNTDAQMSSLDYLNNYAEAHPDANIILTGHSKGGNDAIYAYLASTEAVRQLVSHIYNFEGPGVLNENAAIYAEAYAELADKMDTYCPQDSIIGMLLYDHSNIHYIYSDQESSQTGASMFSEHDAFTWHVDENGHFVQVDQSELSKFINSTLDSVIHSLSEEELHNLIDILSDFGVFDVIGNKDSDTPLSQEGLGKIIALVREYAQLTPDERQALVDTVAVAFFSAEYNGGYDLLQAYLNGVIDDTAESAKSKVRSLYNEAAPLLQAMGVSDKTLTQFEDMTIKIVDSVSQFCKDVIGYVKSALLAPNSKKTYSRDTINVNIATLRTVVETLNKVQTRIYDLDDKLDRLKNTLYMWEIGDKVAVEAIDFTMTSSSLVDNFLEHVFNKGYDCDLASCIRYLNAVIKQLEDNEYAIISKTGDI